MELLELAWLEVSTMKIKRQVHIYILYFVTNIDHVQKSISEGQLDGVLMATYL
jgi:hypothetical protein